MALLFAIVLILLFIVLLCKLLGDITKALIDKFIVDWTAEKNWKTRIWTLVLAIVLMVSILLILGGVEGFISDKPIFKETTNIVTVALTLTGLFDLYIRGKRKRDFSVTEFYIYAILTTIVLAVLSFLLSDNYDYVTSNLGDVYLLLTITFVILTKLATKYYDKGDKKEGENETHGKRERIKNLTQEKDKLKEENKKLKEKNDELNNKLKNTK